MIEQNAKWKQRLLQIFGDGEEHFMVMSKLARGIPVKTYDPATDSWYTIEPNGYTAVQAFNALMDRIAGKPQTYLPIDPNLAERRETLEKTVAAEISPQDLKALQDIAKRVGQQRVIEIEDEGEVTLTGPEAALARIADPTTDRG